MGNKHWQESEKEIIKQYFNPKKSQESCEFIIKNFLPHRSVLGIQYCAARMQLTRQIHRGRWDKEEIKKLSQLAEKIPFPEIYLQMRYFWARNGMRTRTESAVRNELLRLGFDITDNGNLTVSELAAGLRCSPKVIYRWLDIKEFVRFLKPIRMRECERSPYYISIHNFQNFARKYPGEIARCQPDILWLTSILTSD